jgi:hypothetical protein
MFWLGHKHLSKLDSVVSFSLFLALRHHFSQKEVNGLPDARKSEALERIGRLVCLLNRDFDHFHNFCLFSLFFLSSADLAASLTQYQLRFRFVELDFFY